MNILLAKEIVDAIFPVKMDSFVGYNTAIALASTFSEFIINHCRISFIYNGTTSAGYPVAFQDTATVTGYLTPVQAATFDEWRDLFEKGTIAAFYIKTPTSKEVTTNVVVYPFVEGFHITREDLLANYKDNEDGAFELWSFITYRLLEWLQSSFITSKIPAMQPGTSSGYIIINKITFQ